MTLHPDGTMTLPRTIAVYQQLIEASPDAMVVVNSDGEILLVNHHAEEMFGFPKTEMIGSHVEMLIPKRFGGTHKHHRDKFFAAPTSRPMGSGFELFARRRDGTEFPAEISLSSIRIRGGTLAAAAVRDITDRVRVNAALRTTEEKFRGTFNSAGIAMALVALQGAEEGRIVDSNKALQALTGHGREALVGLEFSALHDESANELPARAISYLLSKDMHSFHYECRWLDGRGDYVWVHVTSSLVRNDAGEPHYCLYQAADLSERKRLEEQLRHQADHDALTDLFNRRRFLIELERALALALRYDQDGSVMMLDLDHFKYVNDTLGHMAGDGLITRTAAVLRSRMRETDILARLGGDEFAVILPETDLATARDVGYMLLAEIREALRTGSGRSGRPVTASIGIAPFPYGRKSSGIELLNEADIAMYDAKELGGDRVAVYEPSRRRHRQMNANLNLAHTIRQALAKKSLALRAQPIRSLNGDKQPRYELLVRLVDDNGELVRPAVFLPVAERFQLAREIDEFVTNRAIDILIEQQQLGREVALAVNLSAQSITDDRLLRLVATRLAAAQLDPKNVCFELTETAAIVNVDNARMFAERLSEIGCEFALDDFGAGYASFYYLKHIHFDYIKIDGEFVRGLTRDPVSQVIVNSVVQLAHGLGKKTIAEFVEDESTFKRLARDGVDYAQGYHIGPPASLEVLGSGVAVPAA